MEDYSYNAPKRQVMKDYERKSYANPYFDRFRRGFDTKLYLKIMLAVFLVYVFIYSDIFKVKTVEITGNDLIPTQEISATVNDHLGRWTFFLFPKNNLIILNKRGVETAIAKNFNFQGVEISRGWQKLEITVKEKVCYLILQTPSTYYYLGLDGSVLKQISPTEASKRASQLPVIKSDREPTIGEKVLSDDRISYLLDLDKALSEHKLKPQSYEIKQGGEVDAVFPEGWRAMFDSQADISLSVENLSLVLSRKVTDRKSLQYVDLQLVDKVYYK